MHLLPSPGTRPADGSFSYQIEEGSTLVKVSQYHYTDEHDFGYGNPKGEYTIPNVVSGYVKDENEDTYRYVTCPITCVGLGGQGNSFTELTAVTVSEGVVRLDRAFKGCDKLRSVKLPSTMRTIDSAFYGCSSLQSIVIPDQVYDVGSQSFYGCTQLQRVTMPSALAKIGDQTFANCESLVELILPETCQSMGDGVFKDCAVLEYVDLGSCKNIGVSAFSGCTNLAGVVSVAAVTNIANSAFYNCGMLENIILPSGLTSIGDNAFYQCVKLHGLVFPKGLLHIGSGAFNCCSAIEEIVFSDGLLDIGANAFRNCAGIRKVRIPGTVTNIGAYAVSSLLPKDLSEAALWQMDYSSVTNLVMLDGATTFGDYQTTSRHSALKRVELASTVVKINAQALSGCENLSEVAIRGRVESVGNKAFYNCSGLSEVPDFGGCVTNWGTEVFSGCTGLTKVVVPGSMKDVPSKMFYNCSGISELIIEEGVESTRNDSFLYDYNIRSLSLPSTLTNIANVTVNTAPRVSEVVTCHQEVPPANLNKAFLKNFTGTLYYPPQYRSAWEAYLQEKGLSPYGKTWAEATESDPGEVKVNGVHVTYWWLAKYKLTESSTPEQAAGVKTGKTDSEGNDMWVWQDYVAGTDPTDPASVFTAVIAVTNGKVYVSWSPDLNVNDTNRIYKVYGREKLEEGEWETPIQPWHRFFKVAVAMPTGEEGEETAVAGEWFVPGENLGGVQLWEGVEERHRVDDRE